MQDIGHIYSFFTLFVNFSLLFNGAEESDGSMQWFHFFDGIFPGQWYPEGFHAKIMVLKRFTREKCYDKSMRLIPSQPIYSVTSSTPMHREHSDVAFLA